MQINGKHSVVIIGAGPAGLGCAHELQKYEKVSKLPICIYEKNDRVGGLARTYRYKNYSFDLGPHRFYTKNTEVLLLWKETLGKNFIEVPRLTRILYNNKLIIYPLELFDVIKKLGVWECFLCSISFIHTQLRFRNTNPKTFEDWITKNFGYKLFLIFFKTYTEKIWGIPTNHISAQWAAQRIKNLDLLTVIKKTILNQNDDSSKSLVKSFFYPKNGAGSMYEKLAHVITSTGATISTNAKVVTIHHENNRIMSVEFQKGTKIFSQKVKHLFSSMPLTEFILALSPQPNKKIVEAAKKLYYRDHITVNLLTHRKVSFLDNWIYIHDPTVAMARVTNYNSFVSNKRKHTQNTALSVEYFTFKTDSIWKLTDKQLIDLAKQELAASGLVEKSNINGGFVIREMDSYPAYYIGHTKYFLILKDYVNRFHNLACIGRGGMYKYNNMDHSIYSGMLAARNFLAGKKLYDLWQINVDAQYLEQK